MKTYQDLEKCGDSDYLLCDFVQSVISDHQSSDRYKIGTAAGQFYRHCDPDLQALKRLIYDNSGNVFEDKYSADYRIESNYFYMLITQTVMYLLGNGISFDNEKVKKQMGGTGDFDFAVQQTALYAACDGEAYGYIDPVDGVLPLCYACRLNGNEPTFAPLYDEKSGEIKGGVRYWRLADEYPLQAVLYRESDYIRFSENDEKTLEMQEEPHRYGERDVSNDVEGVYSSEKTGLKNFPIVKMPYINNQSAIVGNRTLLFAYDVVFSGMVNKIDMNLLYWILKNADGMSKKDDVQFVLNLIRTRVMHLHDDMDAQVQEVSSNTEAYREVLAELRKQLFLNFMCIDTENVSAGNVTATQIKTAYQNMDLQANALEHCVSEFIKGVLKVHGRDPNEPFHFTRDKAINESERINNSIAGSKYLGEDMTTRLIAESLGLIDEVPKIQAAKEQQEQALFGGGDDIVNRIADMVYKRLKGETAQGTEDDRDDDSTGNEETV